MLKRNLALALAAGLLGGLVSHYITAPPALAQAGPIRELRAQSLAVVDDKNNLIGTFRASAPPGQTIVLLDRNNKEIWRAGISARVLTQK